jgi:hypothetical protein
MAGFRVAAWAAAIEVRASGASELDARRCREHAGGAAGASRPRWTAGYWPAIPNARSRLMGWRRMPGGRGQCRCCKVDPVHDGRRSR